MSRRAGFTVLEAAVALAIIGLSAVGVLSAFAGQTRSVTHVRDRLQSAALAQDVGARIRLLSAEEREPLADSLARGRFEAPFADHEWTARLEPVSNEPGLRSLTVTVRGPEGDFESRSLIYELRPPAPPTR